MLWIWAAAGGATAVRWPEPAFFIEIFAKSLGTARLLVFGRKIGDIVKTGGSSDMLIAPPPTTTVEASLGGMKAT